MEEVQQDMKSFGIDGYNNNNAQPAESSLTPQPSSSNEDFDPTKNYGTEAGLSGDPVSLDAAGADGDYAHAGYGDFSNYGAFGSDDSYGALNSSGGDGGHDSGGAAGGAGFSSFLDANSDFSFFTSSFDAPVADGAATNADSMASLAAPPPPPKSTTSTKMSTAKTPIPGGGKTPTKNGAGKKSTAKTPATKSPASKSPTKSTTKAKNSVKTPAPPKLGDKESSSGRFLIAS